MDGTLFTVSLSKISALATSQNIFFQSNDGRIRLYQCDFLALTSDVVATKFDAVWDIQALVAINPRDRKQYVRTVRSLLADEFRWALSIKPLMFGLLFKGCGQSAKLGTHSAICSKLGTALQAYTLNPCTKFPPNPTSRKVNT